MPEPMEWEVSEHGSTQFCSLGYGSRHHGRSRRLRDVAKPSSFSGVIP